MIPSAWIDQAARRLVGQIEKTPLTCDPELSLLLKWENRQLTGSFKMRGAANKVLSLEGWERQRGLVTASAGNHGQGLALAAGRAGAPVTVFASQHAVPAKLDAMRALGATVRLVEGGYEAAEKTAQAFAAQSGATWVSPYNDGQVIAGQATVCLEMIEQVQETPAVLFVPVGGGGLLAGIGAAIERFSPRPRLVGVQSEASPFFYELFYRGTQAGAVELESLADGLAGAVEEGSLTIPMVRRYTDAIMLVSEEQVASAVAFAWERYHERIEGSAAAALAAALAQGQNWTLDIPRPQGKFAVVISGGNIQPEIHARICAQFGAGTTGKVRVQTK